MERRLLFEAKDIRAVRFRCKHCLNELYLRVASSEDVPRMCPICDSHEWIEYNLAHRLLRILREFSKEDPSQGATVLLETDAGKTPG